MLIYDQKFSSGLLFLWLYLFADDNGKSGTVGLLHIQDAVVGIGAALEKGQTGEVYNIGGQCDCSPSFVQLIPKVYCLPF